PVGVAHDLAAQVVVRHLVDDVGADAPLVQLAEVRRRIDRAGAAVAGDDGGDALRQVVLVVARGRGGQAGVAVGVQVDEAGRGVQPRGVDDPRRAFDLEAADGDDAVPLEGQVAGRAGVAAAVVEDGAAEDDVRLDGRLGGGQDAQQQGKQALHGSPAVRG